MSPDVRTYYEQTDFDYRVVWGPGRGRAVHFGFYDEHATRHRDALDNLNRALVDFAGIRPGERVLDAGCGRGSACFWLAEQRGCVVTGINLVARQLAGCRREASRRGLPGLDFLEADYCRTPFPDAVFDVVWACESQCHAADKSAFYREAFRVLKPGGRLVVADFVRASRPVAPPGEDLLAAWLRPWAIPDLDTADEHRAHARAAGFADLTVRDVTANVRVSLRNLHELCRRWLFFGKILRFSRLISRVRLDNVRASMRQYEALEAGAWGYGFLLTRKAD